MNEQELDEIFAIASMAAKVVPVLQVVKQAHDADEGMVLDSEQTHTLHAMLVTMATGD